ncbi:MAG: ribosomal-processing cysteine protease Prp [Lachnospiraceae bacterium]|nr:ribosomal-processing cysteine protease Prp [Lachnospiraceae bacterium]
MTTVTLIRDANHYKEFYCFGHARKHHFWLTKDTQDIICASISVLVINTINSLEELAKEELSVTTNEETGFIRCVFEKEPSGEGDLLMDSLVLGLKSISKQYGENYLQVKFEEV